MRFKLCSALHSTLRSKLLLVCVMLLSIGVVISCSSESAPIQQSNVESEYGELPSSIGDVTSVHAPSFNLREAYNEGLAERTEYANETGTWFSTGFAISSGYQLPGDEVSVRLSLDSYDDHRFRYQLTERNASLERLSLVEELVSTSQNFRANLPDKKDALYLLSVEALDDTGEVLDTLLSLVRVAEQEMNARLYTAKTAYEPSESMILYLENFGPTDLFFGTPYTLEKLEAGTWTALDLELNFDSIGIRLEPGNIYEQAIDLSPLGPGQYRVIKTFDGEGTELEATLAAEFEVIK